MTEQQMLIEAKNAVLRLKKEEQKNINPYAGFADQMIGLIGDKKVTSKEVLEFTELTYSRSRMNRQWKTFGRVLTHHMKDNWEKKDILFFLGFLKRLLTIEGKRQAKEQSFKNENSQGYGNKREQRPNGNNNKNFPKKKY